MLWKQVLADPRALDQAATLFRSPKPVAHQTHLLAQILPHRSIHRARDLTGGGHSWTFLDLKPWWYHLLVTCFCLICSKQTWHQWATTSVTVSLWRSLHLRLDWKGKVTYTWWFHCKWGFFGLPDLNVKALDCLLLKGKGCSQHLCIFNGTHSRAGKQSHYSDQLLDEPGHSSSLSQAPHPLKPAGLTSLLPGISLLLPASPCWGCYRGKLWFGLMPMG